MYALNMRIPAFKSVFDILDIKQLMSRRASGYSRSMERGSPERSVTKTNTLTRLYIQV